MVLFELYGFFIIKSINAREKTYHNTELLLKKYSEVVWSIEVSAIQAQISFEVEMGCKPEGFLEMSYAVGADLAGQKFMNR